MHAVHGGRGLLNVEDSCSNITTQSSKISQNEILLKFST